MYVRQKRNKSGLVSVQVIDKSSGVYKVVKTVGVSRDPISIVQLEQDGKRYIKEQSCLVELDFDQVAVLFKQFIDSFSQVRVCGINFCWASYLTTLGKNEVIENYKQLWQIEKAFRVAKTDIKIRPIYHHLPHRIEVHICITFVAYKIYKELERPLKELNAGMTPEKAIETATTIYSIKVMKPKSIGPSERVLLLNDEQKNLYNLFKNDSGVPVRKTGEPPCSIFYLNRTFRRVFNAFPIDSCP